MKYRPSSFLMLALASGVFLEACSTARKNKEAGNSSLLNGIVLAQPLSRSEIDSLKEIADLPTSMLPSSAGQIQSESAQNADRQRDAESSNLLTADSGWEELGADPKEVNPGDVFSENEGALLEKSFSLADGLTASERRSLLNQFTMISTAQSRKNTQIASLRPKAPPFLLTHIPLRFQKPSLKCTMLPLTTSRTSMLSTIL